MSADDGTSRHQAVFFEVFEGLPWQGSGSRACTARALALCVLTAPGAVVRRAGALGLRTLDVDLDLPRHAVGLVWHPRFDADAGHRWFRAQLVESVEALGI